MAPITLAMLETSLPPRLRLWAKEIYAAHLLYDVDPWIFAAICDRESLGGAALKPAGAHGTGDDGHGRGLWQIDDRSHFTFLAAHGPDGVSLWQRPAFNALYGALVLRQALEAFKGEYFPAIAAYNCGVSKVRSSGANKVGKDGSTERINALDKLTARGTYLSDVLSRRDVFLANASKPQEPTT